jgi:hypothetical protein
VLIFTELVREAATLVMLLAPGALISRKRLERFAWFCWSFAVWDLFYYVFLKLLLDWARKLIYLGCALFTARGMGRPGVGALHNLVGLAGLGYHPAACPCEKPGLSTYQLALGPSGNRSTALLPVLY